jgi:hypothetical protein
MMKDILESKGENEMSGALWSQSDLMKLSRYSKPDVRRWACERMNTLYGQEGIGILDKLLNDGDRDVLFEALLFLEKYPDPRFKETLLKMCKIHKGAVSGRCAEIVGKMKDERLLEVYAVETKSKSMHSDEVLTVIKAMGELATDQARRILRESLSEISDEADPILIDVLIFSLLKAKEDLSVLLDCYERHYGNLAMEILYPFTSICGSWYSLADLKEKGRKRILKEGLPPVVAESLSYMKERGFPSLAKDLDREFKTGDFSEVIKTAAEQVDNWVMEKGTAIQEDPISKNDSPPQANYRILKAFSEFSAKGPKESFKAMAIASIIILARFVEFRNLVGLRVAEIDEKALFDVLFDERGTLEIDDELEEKILKIVPPKTIYDHCLGRLRDFPGSWAAERALRLLGRLKDPGAIPGLIDFLREEANDHSLEECIQTLAHMGTPLVAHLEKVSGTLNSEQWAEILYALKDIPEERTADFLLQHWNRLWTDHKEPFIYALEGVASHRFIEPLKKELREGEALEEEAFYLLCHIHGLEDPLLPQIEKEMALKRKETERRMKAFEGEKLEALMDRTTRMELKCRQCGRTYHYEVENIYVSKDRKEQPKILDKIVCKNCRAVNQYEMTPMGQMAMTSQLVLLTLMAEKGKLDPEASPIKLGETGLIDGRRMSFDEAEEILGIEGRSESFPFSQKVIRQGKVGRNAPCPCGSGKKYKRCCLQKEEQKSPEKTSLTLAENELRKRLLSFSSKERYKKDYERVQ